MNNYHFSVLNSANEYWYNVIKIYLLMPIIALLSGVAIYVCLVTTIYKLLAHSEYTEKLIWRNYVSRNIIALQDNRIITLQKIVNNLLEKEIDLIIIQDPQINAFAAPSKKIIITTGLLDNIKTDEALTFVIAHEIAHIKRKDYLYEFSRYVVSHLYKSLWLPEMIAEMLQLIDRRKIREAEFAADKYAKKLIMQQYGNAKGAEQLFYHLRNQNTETCPQITIKDRLDNLGLQK